MKRQYCKPETDSTEFVLCSSMLVMSDMGINPRDGYNDGGSGWNQDDSNINGFSISSKERKKWFLFDEERQLQNY